MKQYKLIKTYPGSPYINSVFQLYKHYKGDYHKHPEFWEEIIEKNYEILSFKHLNLNIFVKIISNDCYYYDDKPFYYEGIDQSFTLKKLVDHPEWNIHSVKRLSDNVVFTIGDKVQDSLTDNLTDFKIQEIVYFNEGVKIICNAKSGTTMPLNTIRHIKKQLFTTEDGIDVFENDYITTIHKEDLRILSEGNFVGPFGRKSENYLYFSTLEKAKEYVLMNKPCLSINDIFEMWKSKGFSGNGIFGSYDTKDLINLVKSKL